MFYDFFCFRQNKMFQKFVFYLLAMFMGHYSYLKLSPVDHMFSAFINCVGWNTLYECVYVQYLCPYLLYGWFLRLAGRIYSICCPSRTVYQFIADNKRCPFFFRVDEHCGYTYRGHIDGHAAWTSRDFTPTRREWTLYF